MYKKFFFACLGILCLVLAYHCGATNAQGQAGSTVTGFGVVNAAGIGIVAYSMTSDGDCYSRRIVDVDRPLAGAPRYIGNFWSGATYMSMGRFKVTYK